MRRIAMLLRLVRIHRLPRRCCNEGNEKAKGTGMTSDHIRRVLDTIYDKVFNQGQADLYPGLVSGPYIQHNPIFANGLDDIVGYIKQAGCIPCEVKRVAIDGDLAFVHVRYLDGEATKPRVSTSSASTLTARWSSTGMCCSRCQPRRITATRCSRQ